MEKFSYCVAREKQGKISIYTYGSDVHHGTLQDAIALLKYVQIAKRDDPCEYYIQKVTFDKVEIKTEV